MDLPWSHPLPNPADGETHLWLCDIGSPGSGDAGESLLDENETARWKRFRFERDRQRFLASHVFLRTVLARYAGCEPGLLRFRLGARGKPALVPSRTTISPPSFNLSHSANRALLAVSGADAVLGVDIEQWRPERRLEQLARRNFAPSETNALLSAPSPEQPGLFYRIWTLKEAYLKARGTGLALRLNGFAFSFGPGDRLRLEADRAVDALPQRWRCASWEVEEGFGAALVRDAIADGIDHPRLRFFETRPLQWWREDPLRIRYWSRA